ncbi:MAG: UDP-N-acetylmuramate--L-alanine ligase [Deltaproteobacteria bacterium]|nr:UDP-N-acetylmuramate--L-alanine ligase [Deltaproteobacteria bacterium]
MFKKYRHIHFVGIGGIGMSGIAEVVMNLGYHVSGSDLKASALTRRLRSRGARINYGHRAGNVVGAQVVVVSSAVNGSNPEIVEARRCGIPVVPRAEMLAELMRLKYGIAVAGTHGKTTTTSLIAHVLAKSGLDPTIVIGGRVKTWRSNARLGKGDFLVAEADESDRSFLHLTPTIAVITNIDPEHLENYRGVAHLHQAFAEFAAKVPFYGAAVCCVDHPVVATLAKRLSRRVITYGLTSTADFSAREIAQIGDRLTFTVCHHGREVGRARLRLVGRHNVANALAAIAVATELEVPVARWTSALAGFGGIDRRFEILSRRGPIVVSDYAHHPTELAAVIEAARDGWPGRRVVMVHQPHRFTRLRALFNEFVRVLGQADACILMRLYAAGEQPLPGVSARRLWGALRRRHPTKPVSYAETPEKILEIVRRLTTPETLVCFAGAGDVWKVAKAYAKEAAVRRWD